MEDQLDSLVLAAVVIAVLLAERLGGSRALARRLFQAALGLVLALAVVAGTNAFLRPPEVDLSDLGGLGALGGDLSSLPTDALQPDLIEDLANNASETASVQAGVAIAAVIAGLAAMTRYATTGFGVALGGVILTLFAGGNVGRTGDCTSIFNAGTPLLGLASEGRDIAQFVVLVVGTLALLAFGVWRWDVRPGEEPDPAPAA